MKVYTGSFMNILSSAQLVKSAPPKYYDQFEHMRCPQAKNHARQQNKGRKVNNVKGHYQYRVPTQNKFANLDDYDHTQGNY